MDAPVAAKQVRIALIGLPNCGKTAMFNRLTGSRQRGPCPEGVLEPLGARGDEGGGP